MEQLTTADIYKIWANNVEDNRYLRKNRWVEISKNINRFHVKTVLEFGSGVSSLLFDNLNLKVKSLETDKEYMKLVKGMCSDNVDFLYWDNKTCPPLGYFDLALVDGCLPRRPQLDIALRKASIIAIDDFAGAIKRAFEPIMAKYPRLDTGDTFMAIFKVD